MESRQPVLVWLLELELELELGWELEWELELELEPELALSLGRLGVLLLAPDSLGAR